MDITYKVNLLNMRYVRMTILEIGLLISKMDEEQRTKFLEINSINNVNPEKAIAIRIKDNEQDGDERMAFFERVDSKGNK